MICESIYSLKLNYHCKDTEKKVYYQIKSLLLYKYFYYLYLAEIMYYIFKLNTKNFVDILYIVIIYFVERICNLRCVSILDIILC